MWLGTRVKEQSTTGSSPRAAAPVADAVEGSRTTGAPIAGAPDVTGSGAPQSAVDRQRLLDRFAPSIAYPVPAGADAWRAAVTFGVPGVLILAGLIWWFSRPRRMEEAQDAPSFATALEKRVNEICERFDSPREVRRFLNYLRLVATGAGMEQEGDINQLRKKFGGDVDRDLVDLAVLGRTTVAGAEAEAVEEYYRKQCELFGLDPWKFEPKETVAAQAAGTVS
jgi:hypothetical protein